MLTYLLGLVLRFFAHFYNIILYNVMCIIDKHSSSFSPLFRINEIHGDMYYLEYFVSILVEAKIM